MSDFWFLAGFAIDFFRVRLLTERDPKEMKGFASSGVGMKGMMRVVRWVVLVSLLRFATGVGVFVLASVFCDRRAVIMNLR